MGNNAGTIPNPSQPRVVRELIGRFLRPALLLLLLTGLGELRYTAQQPGGNGIGNADASFGSPSTRSSLDQDPLYQGRTMPGEPGDPIAQERRLNFLNAQRQKAMVEDANKLFKLTTELNEEVNGAHPHPLTSDQLRKVAQIEKLARSVREKMSISVVGSSPMLPQPMPFSTPLMR